MFGVPKVRGPQLFRTDKKVDLSKKMTGQLGVSVFEETFVEGFGAFLKIKKPTRRAAARAEKKHFFAVARDRANDQQNNYF